MSVMKATSTSIGKMASVPLHRRLRDSNPVHSDLSAYGSHVLPSLHSIFEMRIVEVCEVARSSPSASGVWSAVIISRKQINVVS